MKKITGLSPRHERIIQKTWASSRSVLILSIITFITVVFAFVAVVVREATLAAEGDFLTLVGEVGTLAISFLAVTVFRKILNMPRPYEFITVPTWNKEKQKNGEGFPSRHVFSAFVIATVLFPWNMWVSIALYAFGIAMAVSRVLLGMHFIKDVVAGAIIGIASGVIGLLII